MKIARWLMAATLTVQAAPAAAQLEYHAGLDVASSYTARGLTFTNRLVVQPSAELTAAGGSAVLGVWANVEPRAYEGARDLSARNGLPGVTEVDVTLALSRTLYPRSSRLDTWAVALLVFECAPGAVLVPPLD